MINQEKLTVSSIIEVHSLIHLSCDRLVKSMSKSLHHTRKKSLIETLAPNRYKHEFTISNKDLLLNFNVNPPKHVFKYNAGSMSNLTTFEAKLYFYTYSLSTVRLG